MQIESATPADATALRELHVATWTDTYPTLLSAEFDGQRLDHHRRRDWRSLMQAQAEAGGGVLVAREGEEILGLCQYGPTEDPDDRACGVGHIHRLYVHPAAQRRGVGRALLEAATQRMPGSVTLWALEADTGARSFYERLGFTADGARRFDGAWDVRYRRAR